MRLIEEIYRSHYNKFYNYAMKRFCLFNEQKAKDLIHDAFLKVMVYFHSHPDAVFDPDKGCLSLIYLALEQAFYDWYRKDARWRKLDLWGDDKYLHKIPDLRPKFYEYDLKTIEKEVKRHKNWSIFIDYVDGYKYEELAKGYGITITDVKSRIYRLRRKLRQSPVLAKLAVSVILFTLLFSCKCPEQAVNCTSWITLYNQSKQETEYVREQMDSVLVIQQVLAGQYYYLSKNYQVLRNAYDTILAQKDTLYNYTVKLQDAYDELYAFCAWYPQSFFYYKDTVIIYDNKYYISPENDTFRVAYFNDDLGYQNYYQIRYHFKDTSIFRHGTNFCEERIQRSVVMINGQPNYVDFVINLCESETTDVTLYGYSSGAHTPDGLDYEFARLKVYVNEEYLRIIELDQGANYQKYDVRIEKPFDDIETIRFDYYNDYVYESGGVREDRNVYLTGMKINGRDYFHPDSLTLDINYNHHNGWNEGNTMLTMVINGSVIVNINRE